MAYVAEGTVKVSSHKDKIEKYTAGESFSLTEGEKTTTLINSSKTLSAKVIAFHLR